MRHRQQQIQQQQERVRIASQQLNRLNQFPGYTQFGNFMRAVLGRKPPKTKSGHESTKSPRAGHSPIDIFRLSIPNVANKLFGMDAASGERIDPGIEFGRSTGKIDQKTWELVDGKFDVARWELVIDVDGQVLQKGEGFLRLRVARDEAGRATWFPGNSPADAIQAMVDNPRFWKMDCAEFVQAVSMVSLLNAIGRDAFDRRVAATPEGTLIFRPIHSNALQIDTTRTRGFATDQNQVQTPKERLQFAKALRDAPVGAEVVFQHPGITDTENPFRNEHAIKVGEDLYYAHGIERRLVSQAEISHKLAGAYRRTQRLPKGNPIDDDLSPIQVVGITVFKVP